MYFFYLSPLGRILNRFSSDTYTVDDELPFDLNILLAQFVGLIGKRTLTKFKTDCIQFNMMQIFKFVLFRSPDNDDVRYSMVVYISYASHTGLSLVAKSVSNDFQTAETYL